MNKGGSLLEHLDLINERINDPANNNHQKQHYKIAFVIYVAFACVNNKRRYRMQLPDSERTDSKLRIPMECYSLIRKLLHDEDLSSVSGTLINRFEALAQKVCERFIYENASLNAEELKNTKSGYKRYKILYELLVNNKFNKALYKTDFSDKEINDAYKEIRNRFRKYQKENRENKQLPEKDADVLPRTRIEFKIKGKKCTEIVKQLNETYNNIKEGVTKEKLENILLPIYCTIPYTSICIIHKNRFPKFKEILSDDKAIYEKHKNDNFIYAVAVMNYEICRDKASYSIINKVLSNETANLLPIKKERLGLSEDINSYLYNIKEEHSSQSDYSSFFNLELMKENYDNLNRRIINYFYVDSDKSMTNENLWFPLNTYSNNLYDLLSGLSKDSKEFTIDMLFNNIDVSKIELRHSNILSTSVVRMKEETQEVNKFIDEKSDFGFSY